MLTEVFGLITSIFIVIFYPRHGYRFLKGVDVFAIFLIASGDVTNGREIEEIP